MNDEQAQLAGERTGKRDQQLAFTIDLTYELITAMY